MSQTKIQGPFLANTSVSGAKLSETINISSNTTFSGANTKFTGANTTFSGSNTNFTSSNTHFVGTGTNFTGANVFFSNTTHVNFTGANVVGLPAGGANPATTTVYTAAQRFNPVNITNAGGDGYGTQTVTLNLANNNFYSIALANNITLANPTGIGNTQSGSIFLTQDSTGNRTVTFGSYWRFPSGSAPSLSTSANAQDRLDYVVFASNNIHTSVTLDLLGT